MNPQEKWTIEPDSPMGRALRKGPLRVVVTGGRNYSDVEYLNFVLNSLYIVELAQGGATGADSLARRWAEKHSVPCTTYDAEWAKYRKAAGIMRNREMLTGFRPDLVVAFPGGKGTAHCVQFALSIGIPVWKVPNAESSA